MKGRSRVHMLMVAAARLRADHANPKLIADLEAAAKLEADRKAEGRFDDDQQKRIERQRTLFAMLPSGNAADRLKAAMLQRCYDLMWDGDGLACDALAEFLPSAEVEKMFEAWEQDSLSTTDGRSRFYRGEAAWPK